MDHLMINHYTIVFFRYGKPVRVNWIQYLAGDMINDEEWTWTPNSELVKQVEDKLKMCGWKCKLSEPRFIRPVDEDNSQPFVSEIELINN